MCIRDRPSGSGSGSGSSSSSSNWFRISSSLSSSRPGASKGLRRRRCGSDSSAACRTSSVVTSVRPAHAASVVAVRAVTMSARMPSTSKPAHTAAIRRSAPSPSRTLGSSARAAAMRSRSASSSAAHFAAKATGSSSYASRRRTTSTRSSVSREAATSTVSPKRSSNCGRSSPSSGFMVPTRRKRAAWRTETPSRSTDDEPVAAASRRESTRWSPRRLTSST